MNRKIFLFGISLLVLIITACSESNINSNEAANQQVNVASDNAKAPLLPAFKLQDAAGNKVELQEMKGKKVFVNLWATWCPPCRREMPSIEKLARSVDTGKVAFVMLALDDEFEKAKQFVVKQKLDLPIYYPAENLPTLFNVQGIPSTFIFNEQGVLIHRIDGGDDYDTKKYRDILN